MAKIDLAKLLDIEDLKYYKLHLAVRSSPGQGRKDPVEAYLKDGRDAGEVDTAWWGWHAWCEGEDRWRGRPYVLSFMRVYPDNDVWLFGGIFKVRELDIPQGEKKGEFYEIHLTGKGREYIGRLKITDYHNTLRNVYRNLENDYSDLNDSKIEILKEPYWITNLRTEKSSENKN